jgi:DNA-binding transcriptional LysR family regulator
MLDAHQLNVFLVAAETLNFTQAAQRLHMSQPSVSQHIQALERHFNLPLFVRAGRNIELSDAGMMLVPLARDLVHQSIHIEETMASLQGGVYGHLHVGCSTTPGKYVLPHLLTRFHHLHPRVRVTCQVTSQNQAVEMLANGDVHFALTSQPQRPEDRAEFKPFLSDPVSLIAPLSHPWAEAGEIDPEDLHEARFILREETSGTYAAVQRSLASAGISMQDLRVILTLGNSEAIALAVQEGLGVGFVSKIVVSNMVQDRVASVQICGVEIARDIYIGHHTRRPATTAQTAFWDFIQQLETVETFMLPERPLRVQT